MRLRPGRIPPCAASLCQAVNPVHAPMKLQQFPVGRPDPGNVKQISGLSGASLKRISWTFRPVRGMSAPTTRAKAEQFQCQIRASTCLTTLDSEPEFGPGGPDDARVPDRPGSGALLPGVPGGTGGVQHQDLTVGEHAGLPHCRRHGRLGRPDALVAPQDVSPAATRSRLTPAHTPVPSPGPAGRRDNCVLRLKNSGKPAKTEPELPCRSRTWPRNPDPNRPKSAGRRAKSRLQLTAGIPVPSTGNCCGRCVQASERPGRVPLLTRELTANVVSQHGNRE